MSAGTEGLTRSLAATFTDAGWAVEVVIHDEDAWTPDLLVIDAQEIAASIDAELAVETRWRTYLDPRTSGLVLRAVMAVRRARRRHRLLPRGVPIDERHRGFRTVRRLVNIEVAHLTLLRRAQESGARWALILEDDATGDPHDVARALDAVMAAAEAQETVQYINVSRSFDEGQLGIEHLLLDGGGLSGVEGIRIVSAERPVTNTVCAVLYRGSFLEALMPALEAVPLSPVIPIDWKLNEALMSLTSAGRMRSGSCWLLRPAPIVQGSMHTRATEVGDSLE